MHECSECGKSYKSVYAVNSHSRVHKPGYVNAGYVAGAGAYGISQAQVRKTTYDKDPSLCGCCNTPLSYATHKKGNKYCNQSCAARNNNKLRIRIPTLNRLCKQCGTAFHGGRSRQFCTTEHRTTYRRANPNIITEEGRAKMREGGQRSIELQGDARRSANEKLFYDYCNTTFNNVTNNERLFNGWDADVILHDDKIAVLWNGPWHYKKICASHSVEQVQNRDRIKLKEIKKVGYKSYIIRDDGPSNPTFVYEEFTKFKQWIESGCGRE